MILSVCLDALDRAALAWEDTSETVRGSRRSLADVDATLLGPRVAPAAQAFLDTWLGEIKTLQTSTSDHGDALRETALLIDRADADVLERSQRLMMWDDRDLLPYRVLR